MLGLLCPTFPEAPVQFCLRVLHVAQPKTLAHDPDAPSEHGAGAGAGAGAGVGAMASPCKGSSGTSGSNNGSSTPTSVSRSKSKSRKGSGSGIAMPATTPRNTAWTTPLPAQTLLPGVLCCVFLEELMGVVAGHRYTEPRASAAGGTQPNLFATPVSQLRQRLPDAALPAVHAAAAAIQHRLHVLPCAAADLLDVAVSESKVEPRTVASVLASLFSAVPLKNWAAKFVADPAQFGGPRPALGPS